MYVIAIVVVGSEYVVECVAAAPDDGDDANDDCCHCGCDVDCAAYADCDVVVYAVTAIAAAAVVAVAVL